MPKEWIPSCGTICQREVTAEDIQSLDINHSFLSAILYDKEGTVHVRYADEPKSMYIYTAKGGQIQHSGVAGSTGKDDLKHVE